MVVPLGFVACPRCGVLIADAAAHTAWHQRNIAWRTECAELIGQVAGQLRKRDGHVTQAVRQALRRIGRLL